MKKIILPKTLDARVTHLEMLKRPTQTVTPPSNVRLALMRAYQMPLHFYRYLYDQIGRIHHWGNRVRLTDEALSQIIHSNKTEIHILYIDGCPAGFAETSLLKLPEISEIIYFGLVPEYQGRRLSRFFFQEILLAAWDHEPDKVCIQTNTLDNPRALQLYQKAGFEPVSFEDVRIEKLI